MHADSIAINKTTPEYPSAEITETMKYDKYSIIFAIIGFEMSDML